MADFQLATTAPLLLFGGGGIGQKGDRGSEQLFGTRDPLPEDGNLLDTWKNTDTGYVFKKTSQTSWDFIGIGEKLTQYYTIAIVDELGNSIINEDQQSFVYIEEKVTSSLVDEEGNVLVTEMNERVIYA